METNEILKKQAGDLLQNYETLTGIASVTGSCALDLMVCPDLDLHVPADQVKNLFGLAEILYQNRLTDELYIQKGATVGIPEGQHIQVRTNLLSEHAKWKIDGLGISALGELVGWALRDRFPPRNGRTSKALKSLGYNVTIHVE